IMWAFVITFQYSVLVRHSSRELIRGWPRVCLGGLCPQVYAALHRCAERPNSPSRPACDWRGSTRLGNCLVVANYLASNKGQDLFCEIRIQMSLVSQAAQACDLLLLTGRIGRRHIALRLQRTNSLRAAEALREDVNESRIQIVDRGSILQELCSCLFHANAHLFTHFFRGKPGKPAPGKPGRPGIPAPGRPGIPPGAPNCFCKASSCFGSIFDRSGMPPMPPGMPPSPIFCAMPPIRPRIMPPLRPLPPMAFIMSAMPRCILSSLLIWAA